MIIRKEHGMYKEDEESQEEVVENSKIKEISVKLKDGIRDKLKPKVQIDDDGLAGLDGIENDEPVLVDIPKKKDDGEDFVNELIQNFEHTPDLPQIEENKINPTEEVKDELKGHIEKKSSNYHPNQ